MEALVVVLPEEVLEEEAPALVALETILLKVLEKELETWYYFNLPGG